MRAIARAPPTISTRDPSAQLYVAFQPLHLQVRAIDGAVFWIETEAAATIGSIKQSIMNARGIDVIMQKLICAGKLLQDESTPEMCGITERDFLVLVTAKPRPPSLVSTGPPLPSSYQSHLHSLHVTGVDDDGADGADDGGDTFDEGDDEEDDGCPCDEGDGECDEGDTPRMDGCDSIEDEVSRFVEMGYGALEAEQALRLSCNDPRRALALLRSGRDELSAASIHASASNDEAVRVLQDRLRSLPAFHSLQQVVRVDPQIMLVLNTEAMRFEDPKADHLLGEAAADSVSAEVSQEREAVEKAFWDACTLELTSVPPVYERTLQLVQEVQDTLCSLMPAHWEEQILLASEYAEQIRAGIVAARSYSAGLTDMLVVPYMRAVSDQVRMLCSDARVVDMDRWLAATLSPLEAPERLPSASSATTGTASSAATSEVAASLAAASSSCAVSGGSAEGCAAEEGTAPPRALVADGQSAALSAATAGKPAVAAPTPAAAAGATHAELPVLLLRFFRSGFEVLEAIKLDMANSHLAQLLESDPTLRQAIAARPNDFVVLLNAAESDPSLPLGEDGEPGDLRLDLHGSSLVPPMRHPDNLLQLHQLSHHLQPHTCLGHGAAAVLGSASGADGRTCNADRSVDGLHSRLRRRLDGYGDDGGGGDDDDDDLHGLSRGGGDSAEFNGPEDDEDDGYDGPHAYDDGLDSHDVHHHHHHAHAAESGLGGAEMASMPEMHSELMEAVMQQWLHAPAGQSAAQEAARLELSTEEVGQFFHARMLQTLGRLRLGGAQEPSLDQMRAAVGSLAEEDEAAVQQLAALGFAREQAAEAYLACDRNQTLAANFLMDQF